MSRPYDPVKVCIYCGAKQYSAARDKLAEEHIIPLSLAATLVLPEASCRRCEEKINGFENQLTSSDPAHDSMFGPFRVLLDLPTRKRHKRPTKLPVTVIVDGVPTKMHLDIKDYPSVPVAFPVFGRPGLLRNHPRDEVFRGSSLCPVLPKIRDNDERLKRLRATIGKPFKLETISMGFQIGHFAHLLAKIAFSYTVAELGLGTIQSELPALIVDVNSSLSFFVGGLSPPLPFNEVLSKGTHRLQFLIATHYRVGKYLAVAIHLFQHMGSPTYLVLVGKLPRDVEQWLTTPSHREFREYMRGKNRAQNR